jgi:hypothetical protein
MQSTSFLSPVPLGIRTRPYSEPNGGDVLIDGGYGQGLAAFEETRLRLCKAGAVWGNADHAGHKVPFAAYGAHEENKAKKEVFHIAGFLLGFYIRLNPENKIVLNFKISRSIWRR